MSTEDILIECMELGYNPTLSHKFYSSYGGQQMYCVEDDSDEIYALGHSLNEAANNFYNKIKNV